MVWSKVEDAQTETVQSLRTSLKRRVQWMQVGMICVRRSPRIRYSVDITVFWGVLGYSSLTHPFIAVGLKENSKTLLRHEAALHPFSSFGENCSSGSRQILSRLFFIAALKPTEKKGAHCSLKAMSSDIVIFEKKRKNVFCSKKSVSLRARCVPPARHDVIR